MSQPTLMKDILKSVSYVNDNKYIPSKFSLDMLTFIKLASADNPEENATPVFHLKILDKIAEKHKKIANLVFRGGSKSTLMEFLFFYAIIYNELPGIKNLRYLIYVSDTIDNGVKTMRKALQYRWEQSSFLQKYIPQAKFNESEWTFTNLSGKKFVIKGYGVKTGVRGTRELGTRPQGAFIDDILSDQSASSKAEMESISDVIHKAVSRALHPRDRLQLWNGTPFAEGDVLYEAIESGGWASSVFPICEKFDDTTTKETFNGAWDDRWPYEIVKAEYDGAKRENKLDGFNQELMLQISPSGEKLINFKDDFKWFDGKHLDSVASRYNWYITTDIAVSAKTAANFTVIGLWAYNNAGHFMLVDAVLRRWTFDKTIDQVFKFAERVPVLQLAIEINGQQKGFEAVFEQEQVRRNIFFEIIGFTRITDKFNSLNTIVPKIKNGEMWINREIYDEDEKREEPQFLDEMENEFEATTKTRIKARNDDVLDMISATQFLKPHLPDPEMARLIELMGVDPYEENSEQKPTAMESYIV